MESHPCFTMFVFRLTFTVVHSRPHRWPDEWRNLANHRCYFKICYVISCSGMRHAQNQKLLQNIKSNLPLQSPTKNFVAWEVVKAGSNTCNIVLPHIRPSFYGIFSRAQLLAHDTIKHSQFSRFATWEEQQTGGHQTRYNFLPVRLNSRRLDFKRNISCPKEGGGKQGACEV